MLYVRCVWSPKRRTDDTSSEARDNLDGEEKHNDDVEWAFGSVLSPTPSVSSLKPTSMFSPLHSIAFSNTLHHQQQQSTMHGGNSRNAPILVRTRCKVDPWIWVNFLQKEEIKEWADEPRGGLCAE